MSLRVWLPLTKDLRNQGLDNITVTNNGATFNSTGKLGGCYSFDGSDDFISLNGSALYDIIKGGNTPFSVAMWVYHADATRAILFGDYSLSGAINFNIELNTSHSIRFYWASSPDTSAEHTLATLNTWTHIAIIYDGTKINFYMNGELKDTYTGVLSTKTKTSGMYYIGRDSRTGTTAFNGKLNDFRIYDHALSQMEVKQLSQGLVLHYPLNRQGWGQENLISGTDDWSTWYKGARWTAENGILTYSAGTVTWVDADSPCIPWTVIDGKTITVSCELRSDDFDYTSGSGFSLCLIRKSSQATQNYTNRRRECTPIHLVKNEATTTWKRFSRTYINFSDSDFTNTYNGGGGDWFGIYLWNYTNKSIQVRNIKIEFGDVATPWCPNSSDALATTLGLNGTTEYDCSGYCNNGTRNGTFDWTSDTPKYSISTKLESGSEISMPFTYNIDTNPISIGCWHKINTNGTYNPIFSLGTAKSGLTLRGKHLEGGNGSSNFDYTISALQNNSTWHHTMFTYDGTNIRVYQNGELIYTQAAPAVGLSSVSQLQLGKFWATCNSVKTLCDFRIYATALSADDVLSLYQNSAYIDSSGNVYGTIHEV